MAMRGSLIWFGGRPLLVAGALVLAALVAGGVYLSVTHTQASKSEAPEYQARVRTIYPAQASWEFVTSPEHPGSSSVKAGTACSTCHGTAARWAGPPADHRQGFGCQACHGGL